MNTDLTTAAVERLTAQLGEALFGEPGLSLMEIANRRAEIEALVKDAGRYRALASSGAYSPGRGAYCPWGLRSGSGERAKKSELDKAIDAAMREQAE